MLVLLQKTWQRLENIGILHDAIPCPSDRVGIPMHVKVLKFLDTRRLHSFCPRIYIYALHRDGYSCH